MTIIQQGLAQCKKNNGYRFQSHSAGSGKSAQQGDLGMDLIIGLSGMAMAFAGVWLILALLIAACAGGAIVILFGSVFLITNRLMQKAAKWL